MNDIEKALLIENETESILALGEIIWKKTEVLDNFENLTEVEKTFIYVEMLEAEINNGGFDQYFYNTSGDYYSESLQAYKTIGAHKTVKIIEEAFKIFPVNPIPKDNEKRQDILENVDEETSKKWNLLEDKFYEYEENISGLLLEFVKKNKSEFK